MFVYLYTFILTLLDFLLCKTIIFEVKTLILHPFIEPKASGRYFRPVDVRNCDNVLSKHCFEMIIFLRIRQ